MKLRGFTFSILGSALLATPATAGGLFLPGSGAISTARAGAAVASADDGEALSINPAGLAKTTGTTITLSAAIISYSMQFSRRGNYDNITVEDPAYEGTPYPTVKNQPKPPLGLGSFQPVPVVAIVSDLGGAVKGLHLAAGLYAPNAYPFRNMRDGYVFNGDFTVAPPPSRYDIIEQDAAVVFPSIGASYRLSPQVDIGARLSWGLANLKSTVAIWGNPDNFEEHIKEDSEFTAEAKDNFVPAWALGVTYRPTPQLELAAVFNSNATVQAKGDASSAVGPAVVVGEDMPIIGPIEDASSRCDPNGNFEQQKVCIGFQLPMSAALGARYKILGSDGGMRGDVEVNVGWEHWGKRCDVDASGLFDDPNCTSPGQYRVVADAAAYVDINGDGELTEDELVLMLKDNFIEHKLKDTFAFRLGGSFHIPMGGPSSSNKVILRGGLGYDTRAAEDGWLRADIDGAARITTTIGAAYRAKKFEINVGGGVILEGTNSNDGECDPSKANKGCDGTNTETPFDQRRGPDPVNPAVTPSNQAENPVTLGEFKSHYVLFMLGMSTWF